MSVDPAVLDWIHWFGLVVHLMTHIAAYFDTVAFVVDSCLDIVLIDRLAVASAVAVVGLAAVEMAAVEVEFEVEFEVEVGIVAAVVEVVDRSMIPADVVRHHRHLAAEMMVAFGLRQTEASSYQYSHLPIPAHTH